MSKLWIVSEYYYPIVTSTGYYVTEIAEFLAGKGLDVNVITTGVRYNETESLKMSKKERHNNVVIERMQGGEIDKNNFLKRIIRLSFLSCGLFVLLLKRVRKGDKVLFAGFGSFEVTERAAREARNPKTGEKLMVAACKTPKFKPSSVLKKAVNV